VSEEEYEKEYVRIPKWYIKALLLLLGFQVLLSLASIALNLWINFKINMFAPSPNGPLID
jgi:hypothetical protein